MLRACVCGGGATPKKLVEEGVSCHGTMTLSVRASSCDNCVVEELSIDPVE